MPDAYTVTVDWDFIADTLLAERCILFLGPDLFRNAQGSLHEQMLAYVGARENPDILTLYDQEELFLFSSAGAKTKTYYKIKKFYGQPFAEAHPLLEKIARLPFHLAVLLSPDNQLSQVMEAQQFRHRRDFYWRNHKPEPVAPPERTLPLLYNLLGNIEQEESLLLTHNDLFEYLRSILGVRGLPDEIKSELQDAHSYIFLGVPFDKWYLQLLLRLLYLGDHQYQFTRYASGSQASDSVRSLCISQFRIEFVPDNSLQFIEQLYQRLEARGELREIAAPRVSVGKQLIELMGGDQLEEALQMLSDFFDRLGAAGEELFTQATLLSGQMSSLKRKSVEGLLSAEDAELQRNLLRKSLMDLISQARKLE